MKYQPKPDKISNDNVQTPSLLASAIVEHFQPRGAILEPCCGGGSFVDALADWADSLDAFDINHKNCRQDFLTHLPKDRYDWIVTNPPWSKIRDFLIHGMRVADNIVFLMTVNHVWTKARLRAISEGGFGIREILLCDTPKTEGWPHLGFQLGAIHYQRGYSGCIRLTNLKS